MNFIMKLLYMCKTQMLMISIMIPLSPLDPPPLFS